MPNSDRLRYGRQVSYFAGKIRKNDRGGGGEAFFFFRLLHRNLGIPMSLEESNDPASYFLS